VAFPVLDPELKTRVVAEGLRPYLGDTRDAWELGEDGCYLRGKPRGRAQARSAQQELLDNLAESRNLKR
jgi:polyphosphate kinase